MDARPAWRARRTRRPRLAQGRALGAAATLGCGSRLRELHDDLDVVRCSLQRLLDRIGADAPGHQLLSATKLARQGVAPADGGIQPRRGVARRAGPVALAGCGELPGRPRSGHTVLVLDEALRMMATTGSRYVTSTAVHPLQGIIAHQALLCPTDINRGRKSGCCRPALSALRPATTVATGCTNGKHLAAQCR